MARPHEITIGDTKFYIQRFDAFEALEIFGDLQRDILPAAGGALAAAFGAENGPRDEQAMIQALRELSTTLDGKTLKAWADRLIVPDLVAYELPDAQPAKLDKRGRELAFQDFTEILELMFHVIKWNCEGPLGRWLDRFGAARAQMASLSASFAKTSSAS
ncbi:phage tail assembly chaperone [Bordetella petrii]|uniref:Tail assembly chaperone n=1 Tax=Bordetella petrii (strain ATCC BAA-461 / DSM 12804 / CCUG 43448 / CIP 107267 / Se-1111R) TaxID=340100 RepID=A9I930_BORPD|nr:hypothetical protein [Bordetella petrii]CAP41321.1 hypothetical protein predicted by Glimmer/Critica [Bordetella petrii]